MGDLRVQWQEEVKVVFYNMWDDYILQRRIEKAEANFYCGIEIRDDLLSAFNVQYNNRAFLEELRRCEEEKYGYDYFVEWLTQLMDDYVRRSFEQKGCKKVDDNSWSHVVQSRIKWLDNTSFLISRKYPKLAQWCEEQKKQITEFYESKDDMRQKSNSKIERFVALTNQLSFFISNGGITMEYSCFKKVYEEYKLLSISPMIKEIEEAAPGFNALQEYFDFAKCKLNGINLPNMALLDVSEMYKDEGNVRDEAIEAWECVLEKCGELRLSILDFADRYHLRDNYPTENFLQPPFCSCLETDEESMPIIPNLNENAERNKTQGIKSQNFTDVVQYGDKEKLLERLHQLIDNKRGADVGAVLLKARLDNYITRNPTRKEFESEFELIGSWSAISNYMSDNNRNALDRANRIVIFS